MLRESSNSGDRIWRDEPARAAYRCAMHKTIEPTILYFGTPVALISSLNADGSANLAPMSSVWWLGWSCMLGLGQMGQTSENLARTRECVINLPSEDQVANVDRLAMTTGRAPVPDLKHRWGYRHESDKFGQAGLTAQPSDIVAPPRVRECPVQMEGIVHDARPGARDPGPICRMPGVLVGIPAELEVRRCGRQRGGVMKGGKQGRKRRPAGSGARGSAGARGPAKKKSGKGPWSDAPKRGERSKPFGGRRSSGEE
jgi:flavin reductase (DIM6/NTAB) family NADH-FMN oxidoreductase RutF